MKADLDAVRASLGTVSNVSNANLQRALAAAQAHADQQHFMAGHADGDDVQDGIVMLATRLYKRNNSPEGVAGWGDLGVVRIAASDPDIERLWAPHRDMCHAGVA